MNMNAKEPLELDKLDIQLNTASTIVQSIFPGATVYNRMGNFAFTQIAPFIAMRILLGGTVTVSPKGENELYSVMLDGNEYIIYEQDFNKIMTLVDHYMVSWLMRRGYQSRLHQDIPYLLRSNPDLIITGMEYMRYLLESKESEENSDKIKIYWALPDEFACGYYRARLPMAYSNKLGTIHSFITQMMNFSELSYYDVFVFHRAPNPNIIEFFQKMKAQNKIIVLDCDDDLTNIPDWNIAKKYIGDPALKRRIAAIEMSDICTVTNESLKEKMPFKETFVCPNLLDLDFYEEPDQSTKPTKLQETFIGLKAGFHTDGKVKIYSPKNGQVLKNAEELSRSYKPINICWFGSPTHDKDLEAIINPIKKIIRKYEMSVIFTFFGYWPVDFVDIHVEPGNTNPSYEVKDLYRNSVKIVPGIAHPNFPKILKEIDPDIGLCPLEPHEFNLSKSNIKALEFGAIRVPSICSDFGPYQFINHGVDGLKVNNEHGWYNGMEYLIHNHEERHKMGQSIRERVYEEYSWHTDNENRRLWDRYFEKLIELGHASREHNLEVVHNNGTQPV